MKQQRALAWTLWAFVAAAFVVVGLLSWQLFGLTPERWCGIARNASSPDAIARLGACINVLTQLLAIKDHTVIGLLILLGVMVLGVVAVALGVRVSANAPGGVGIDVSADSHDMDGNV